MYSLTTLVAKTGIRLKTFLHLLRSYQWVKNLFLFIPAFFAGEFLDHLGVLFLGFISFSALSSSIYIINDIKDVEKDRQHPVKKGRPIAAGLVSVPVAWVISMLFLGFSLSVAWFLDHTFFLFLLAYAILNIGYSFGLKNLPLVDIFIIASGFIIRTVSGGSLADVQVSDWLVIMIFFLAVFLAFGKRRDDLIESQKSGVQFRKSLEGYSVDFLNMVMAMLSAVIILAYLMYTLSPEVQERFGTQYLYMTTIFVVAGMIRYLQIIIVEQKNFSPVKVLYFDNFIRVVVIGWSLVFFIIIYREVFF